MANFNFNLKEASSKTETPIRLIIRWEKIKLIYSTKLKINPDYWNSKSQRPRDTNDLPGREDLHNKLDKIEADAKEVFRDNTKVDKVPTKGKIKTALDIKLNRATSKTAPMHLLPFIDYIIEQRTGAINPRNNRIYSQKTLMQYANVRDLLIEIQPGVDFDDVTSGLYTKLTKHLTAKNYKINAIGKYIQTFKAIMHLAVDEYEVTNNTKFRNFAVLTEKVNDVYLNPYELKKIYDVDLSENKRLEKVRDSFIIGCWTGLRFSDFTALTPDHITPDDFILIKSYKTDELVKVPIHWTVQSIIDKYDFNFPKPISNQKFNEYLKEVCTLAGIDTPHTKERTEGGRKTAETAPKYEFVSSHSARRSFATNLFNAKFPTLRIMHLTGHKTEKAFLRYIKITPEETAQMLKETWAKEEEQIKMYG